MPSEIAPPSAVEARRAARLRLVGLRKEFGHVIAIDDLSLDVGAGEFLTLLGASGSGKSTTLMSIAGFVRPTRGKVLVNERDQTTVPAHRRDIGIVFQHYALFPHLSVAQNVSFPLEMRNMARAEIRERVERILSLVRLSGYERRRPSELSGGQQQRVALARALVYEPSILCLDEPLGALDKNLREEMQDEIRRIQRELRITTISVTHDQQEAIRLSDRIAVMRSGRIEQVDTPQHVYERPANRFVAEFMGASNFIVGSWVSDAGGHYLRVNDGTRVPVHMQASAPAGAPVGLVVRPERLVLTPLDASKNSSLLCAQVSSIMYDGDFWKVGLILDSGHRLVASRLNLGEIDIRVGQRLNVSWRAEDAWVVGVAD